MRQKEYFAGVAKDVPPAARNRLQVAKDQVKFKSRDVGGMIDIRFFALSKRIDARGCRYRGRATEFVPPYSWNIPQL
ncbi:hypothetical protein ACQZ4X_03205 [Agrobacterium vitis]